jgi:hypothetical protein
MGTFQNAPMDGFQKSGKKFYLPAETLHLNPKLKRELTICNLFVNHHLSAADIIRILDENYENIVLSLIKHQVVLDRRQRSGSSPSHIERRRSLAARAK